MVLIVSKDHFKFKKTDSICSVLWNYLRFIEKLQKLKTKCIVKYEIKLQRKNNIIEKASENVLLRTSEQNGSEE